MVAVVLAHHVVLHVVRVVREHVVLHVWALQSQLHAVVVREDALIVVLVVVEQLVRAVAWELLNRLVAQDVLLPVLVVAQRGVVLLAKVPQNQHHVLIAQIIVVGNVLFHVPRIVRVGVVVDVILVVVHLVRVSVIVLVSERVLVDVLELVNRHVEMIVRIHALDHAKVSVD